MKLTSLLVIFTLLLSLQAWSKDSEICESTGLPDMSNTGLDNILKAGKKLSDQEFDNLRKQICGVIILSDTSGFDDKRFLNMVAKGIGVSANDPQKNQKISQFFNQHKNQLICPKMTGGKLDERPKHLFKHAIMRSIMDFYDEVLFNSDDGFEIDFNAYEIIDGKKETVVDFLEKLIATNEYDNDTLLLLRDDIIDFGGKRGADL